MPIRILVLLFVLPQRLDARQVDVHHGLPFPNREAIVQQEFRVHGAAEVRHEQLGHRRPVHVRIRRAGHLPREDRVHARRHNHVVRPPRRDLVAPNQTARRAQAVEGPQQIHERRRVLFPALLDIRAGAVDARELRLTEGPYQGRQLVVDDALVLDGVAAGPEGLPGVGARQLHVHLLAPRVVDPVYHVRMEQDVGRVRVVLIF